MTRRLAVALVSLPVLLAPRLAPAQETREGLKMLAEIADRLKAYQEDANARRGALMRKTYALAKLGEVADSITPFAAGMSMDLARRKLEELKGEIEREPTTPRVMSDVLANVTQIVMVPNAGSTAQQVRARTFTAIGPLEEDILRDVDALGAESSMLLGLESGLRTIDGRLRDAEARSLRTLRQFRDLATR